MTTKKDTSKSNGNKKSLVVIENNPFEVKVNDRSATGQELSTIRNSLDLRGVLEEKRYKKLMEPPPPHAIRKRPDGYDYLSHGYVTLTLNEIFGFDWDHELLPMNGSYYEYVSPEDAKLPTGNASVTVFGKLTIRIHHFDQKGNPRLVATITKTGFGSAEVRKKMERGDAVKAAQSDSRKVCAAQLGPRLGLTLYWDDEAKQEEFEEKQRRRKAEQEEEERVTPEKLEQAKAMLAEDKSPKEVAEALGLKVSDLSKNDLL